VLALAAAGCAAPRPGAAPAASPPWEVENPIRPLPEPPLGSPADFAALPFRPTPEKVRLGRWLFHDARLSADGTVSCATCHRSEHGLSEPTALSTGIHGRTGRRRSQPILNAAWPLYPVWFWDGRATSLTDQARGPMENPVEMGSTGARVVAAIASIPGYLPYFHEAFGDERVDLARVSEAIASYEATRLSGNSRWDRYEAGDEASLDPLEQEGRDLFFGRAGCKQCHLGPNLSDARFHNLGVGWNPPAAGAPPESGFADRGRYEVTRDPRDMGAFKTPTLREVSRRAPYMHDGSIPDLAGTVLHYWRGGIPNPWLSERIRPVPMSRRDVEALVAFMKALDGEGFEDVAPRAFPQ
jgi:cytochrome c peroxidase